MYEYDTNTSLKELKFTLDSTLGEILDEPLGMKMMEEMLPELVHNPMIGATRWQLKRLSTYASRLYKNN